MGNGASDPHRITESFPDLYADSRGQEELLIDKLCTIVQKQINWKLKQKNVDQQQQQQQLEMENNDSKYQPCSDDDISYMIESFFQLRPYRPIKSKQESFSGVSLNKNWIYATLYIYDIFEEYSPFKMNYLIQNEWINEVFICSSYFTGNDMDLYCCQLIDIMMKCWGNKTFIKYRFNDKNNRHKFNKIYQFIEFKSFYLLNHCLNKKNYLKSFKTTPKNVKIYIYKIIENIQLNPIKNRGNLGIKLIHWFMNKKLIKNEYDLNSDKYTNNKYRLTYIDILKIIVLRINILKKRYKNNHSDKIEMAILELNTLLTKIKKYILELKVLNNNKYNLLIHSEIINLLNNKSTYTPFTPQTNKKLLTEIQVLEFIKIIIALRPDCLFYFNQNNETPYDLAKKYNFKKIIHLLEQSMHQNKYILNSNTPPPPDLDTPPPDNNINDNTNSNSTPSSVHDLFITQPNSKKNNKLIIGETQFLSLKPSKTLPPKSKKLIKHNHSKSDLTLNDMEFGKLHKRNNTKMSKSNHDLNSNNNNNNINKRHTINTTNYNTHMNTINNNTHNEYIDYLTAKSPRKNAIDFGDNNDIKTVIIHNKLTQNNNNKNILNTNRNVNVNPNPNPYYIVDDDDDTTTNNNNNDDIFIVTKGNNNINIINKEPGVILPRQKTQNKLKFGFSGFNIHSSKTVNNNNINNYTKQNELESRIEILENENIHLKSDMRSLKNLVHDLTKTIQQMIQLQTLQQE